MSAENSQPTPLEQVEVNQNQQRDLSEMSQLVHVGESGATAHRPDGKFVSNSELEQIKAHEGQINAGLKGRVEDLVKLDTLSRVHRPNGQIMSKDEIRQITDHQEQIRDGLASRYDSAPALEPEHVESQTSDSAPVEETIAELIDDFEPEIIEIDALPFSASQRVNQFFTKASLKLQELASKAKDYYSDKEKGKERKIVAAAAGVVAVAAFAGLAYYLSKNGHDTSALHDMTPDKTPTSPVDTSVHATPNFPSVEAIQPDIDVTPEVPSVNLVLDSRGDTVWDTVKEYAANNGIKMNNQQIQDEVSKILTDNNQTWESARSLPMGANITLSPERIAEIMKLKS